MKNKQYFTQDNTDGSFTKEELEKLNLRVEGLIKEGYDEKNACDKANNEFVR